MTRVVEDECTFVQAIKVKITSIRQVYPE